MASPRSGLPEGRTTVFDRYEDGTCFEDIGSRCADSLCLCAVAILTENALWWEQCHWLCSPQLTPEAGLRGKPSAVVFRAV